MQAGPSRSSLPKYGAARAAEDAHDPDRQNGELDVITDYRKMYVSIMTRFLRLFSMEIETLELLIYYSKAPICLCGAMAFGSPRLSAVLRYTTLGCFSTMPGLRTLGNFRDWLHG